MLFYGCSSLISLPNISKWNLMKVFNLDSLFFKCSSLEILPDISNWNFLNKNTEEENKIKELLLTDYNNINDILKETDNYYDFVDSYNILKDDYDNKIKFPNYFQYESLNNNMHLPKINPHIPDFEKISSKESILELIENNLYSINSLFSCCSSLKKLPDISKCNIEKVKDINYLFAGCSSLKCLPDISKWKTNNIIRMDGLFAGCSNLERLPDISNWNISNSINISYLFYNCISLKTLPDISNFNTSKVEEMQSLFFGCSSLKIIPDISKWETNNLININGLFSRCSS